MAESMDTETNGLTSGCVGELTDAGVENSSPEKNADLSSSVCPDDNDPQEENEPEEPEEPRPDTPTINELLSENIDLFEDENLDEENESPVPGLLQKDISFVCPRNMSCDKASEVLIRENTLSLEVPSNEPRVSRSPSPNQDVPTLPLDKSKSSESVKSQKSTTENKSDSSSRVSSVSRSSACSGDEAEVPLITRVPTEEVVAPNEDLGLQSKHSFATQTSLQGSGGQTFATLATQTSATESTKSSHTATLPTGASVTKSRSTLSQGSLVTQASQKEKSIGSAPEADTTEMETDEVSASPPDTGDILKSPPSSDNESESAEMYPKESRSPSPEVTAERPRSESPEIAPEEQSRKSAAPQKVTKKSASPSQGKVHFKTPRKEKKVEASSRASKDPKWTTHSRVSRLQASKRSRSPSEEDDFEPLPLQRNISTRESRKKWTRISSNHSARFVSQKRVEIFKSVEKGDLGQIKELLHHTGSAVREPKTNNSLLHVAAANNQRDVVLFLLRTISPNVVNKDGQSPAHLAAIKGHTQTLSVLMGDVEMNHNLLDSSRRTYKNLLTVPLYEAILEGNINKVGTLLKIGADPDYRSGSLVEGLLAKELTVKTARHLAYTLSQEAITRIMPKKKDVKPKEAIPVPRKLSSLNFEYLPKLKKQFKAPTTTTVPAGPGVYKLNADSRGYVCVLNYNTFKDRPDLQLTGAVTDVRNLGNTFKSMGYTGDIHLSLTSDESKIAIEKLKKSNKLDDVGCLIVIVSGHGIGDEKFLTSDMQYLTADWICNQFKDAECPKLQNKPKIFIFDFSNTHTKEQKNWTHIPCTQVRLEEPLKDMMCLFCNGLGYSAHTFTRSGTPFSIALCNTLAEHSYDKEMTALYREFVKEYTKTAYGVPYLRNIGFSKKFYFNSIA